DVGLVHPGVTQEILCRSTLGDDLETGILEQTGDSFAEENRIVCEHYAHAPESLPRGRERWKARRQARNVELEEPLGLVDSRQIVVTQIGELVRRLECVASSLGEQDLAAAAGLSDPGRSVDIQPVVRAVANG